MPKLAVYKLFTFYIFSADVLNEPPHVHVAKEKGGRQYSAKIWLESLVVVRRGSLTEKELNTVLKILEDEQVNMISAFNRLKYGHKIKTTRL